MSGPARLASPPAAPDSDVLSESRGLEPGARSLRAAAMALLYINQYIYIYIYIHNIIILYYYIYCSYGNLQSPLPPR